ncbi:putative glycosyltransferase [Indibacter alkaliphilus LW1]|uniref:Glycosyltransferase n=2 Tax=Indibacter TaxID=647744 RepID=S2D376_INDAL|nr:putative glycosyltransferase [Indibacter alkaliphilus LW1]
MITYNHKAFINQAIEGVLMQETDFDIELIIADDASPDQTKAIVEGYINNNSKNILISYTKHSQNIGMINNFIWALKLCKGKYIAICEGDDYWTDPLKLQRQLEFLECNPEFVLTYHPVDVLFPDRRIEEDFGIKNIIEKSETNIYDVATFGNFIHTPSVVFRNIIKEFPNQFYQSPIGDFFLYMLLAEHGNFYALSNKMAVYRYGVGIHSSQDSQERAKHWIKTLSLIKEVIKDNTIKKILELRIQNKRLQTLPSNLQSMQDLNDINTAKVLIRFVPIKNLISAIFRKIWR